MPLNSYLLMLFCLSKYSNIQRYIHVRLWSGEHYK